MRLSTHKAHVWSLLLALAVSGCGGAARQNQSLATADLSDDPMVEMAASPRSVLLGGAGGFEEEAPQIGRTDWPSAYRDEFAGESISYLERYYDVQASPAAGYYWGRGYTQQQFNSYRAGTYQR